jgi:Putative beta-barrel porin 2
MKKHVLLVAALIICSRGIGQAEASSSFPISLFNSVNTGGNDSLNVALQLPQEQTMNWANGGYGVPNPPTIGQPSNYGPQPTNELVPGGPKNVIEEATHKLWRLILTIRFGVYYDSNIFITEEHTKSDTVFQAAGGFSFELGDYRDLVNNFFLLKYLATGYIYTDHSDLNGVDQDALLRAQYRFGNFTAQSNIAFSYLTGPDRLAGTYTSHYFVDGLFRLLYDLSDKTQLHAEFEQITEIYPSQLNSYEYIGRAGVDYLITPKIKLGVEGVIGSLHLEDGGESFYGQGRLRAAYFMTEKLSFLGSVGVEVRDYGNRNLVKVTPVFDLGVNYTPFVDTNFGLTAFRKVFASPVEVGQVFTGTGVQGSVSQRFFQRFTAAVFVGYENDDYHTSSFNSVSNAFTNNRTDNFFYVRPSLSYDIGGWFRTTVYYEFSRNSSSLDSASFNDNRVGMQVIFAF